MSGAIEQIQRLKYRYMRALDTKDWNTFSDTLTPDVVAGYDGGELKFDNRDALVAYMQRRLSADQSQPVITDHHLGHPDIEVDGDTATGSWYLTDLVISRADGVMLRGAAYYDDTYRLCSDGQWRIASTGYERTYVVVWPLAEVPNFHLTTRWD